MSFVLHVFIPFIPHRIQSISSHSTKFCSFKLNPSIAVLSKSLPVQLPPSLIVSYPTLPLEKKQIRAANHEVFHSSLSCDWIKGTTESHCCERAKSPLLFIFGFKTDFSCWCVSDPCYGAWTLTLCQSSYLCDSCRICLIFSGQKILQFLLSCRLARTFSFKISS